MAGKKDSNEDYLDYLEEAFAFAAVFLEKELVILRGLEKSMRKIERNLYSLEVNAEMIKTQGIIVILPSYAMIAAEIKKTRKELFQIQGQYKCSQAVIEDWRKQEEYLLKEIKETKEKIDRKGVIIPFKKRKI